MPPLFPTAASVLKYYLNHSTTLWASDTHFKPFIYPLHALGPSLLCAYILFIPPISSTSKLHKPVYFLRYPLLAFIVYMGIKTMRECRSPSVTIGYGIGLMSSLGILWSAMALVFGDARGEEFGRWEKRRGRRNGRGEEKREEEMGREERNRVTERAQVIGGGDGDDILHSRRVEKEKPNKNSLSANGEVNREMAIPAADSPQTEASSLLSSSSPDQMSEEYVFQTLPATFFHRLDWVADLMTNLRGINWSHRAPHQPPNHHFRSPPPPGGRWDLLRSTTLSLIIHYILIDILKTLTLSDPDFFTLPAPSSSSPPPPFPSTYQLFLSLILSYSALHALFLLCPFFACILGPRILGPHADPMLYPPYFRSVRLIATKGVAGLWGMVWHQLFRLPLESAGEFFAQCLGAGWERHTRKGQTLRLLTAFTLSGILHACASYTTLPRTNPISEAFLFFLIQPLGIIIQRGIGAWIRQRYPPQGIPNWVEEAASTMYVLVWLRATGPLIARDFARNGVWLFEPVPVSLVRGFKWCWSGQWVRWWGEGRWWELGLAF